MHFRQISVKNLNLVHY